MIEEVEDFGRSEYWALASLVEQLKLHLLKWQYQGKMRSPSWRRSVDKQRIQIERLLEDNPRLKRRLDDIAAQGYKYGRKGAVKETDLRDNTKSYWYAPRFVGANGHLPLRDTHFNSGVFNPDSV